MFERLEHEGGGWWRLKSECGVIYEGDFDTEYDDYMMLVVCDMYYYRKNVAVTSWEQEIYIFHINDTGKIFVHLEDKIQCASLPSKKELCIAKLSQTHIKPRYTTLREYVRAICSQPKRALEITLMIEPSGYYV